MSVDITQKLAIVITNLLTEKPALRDSDAKLCALIWFMECEALPQAERPETMKQFLATFAYTEHLTSPESIVRCRRKLQEEYPSLRGKTWVERHKKEIVIQDQLGYNVDNH